MCKDDLVHSTAPSTNLHVSNNRVCAGNGMSSPFYEPLTKCVFWLRPAMVNSKQFLSHGCRRGIRPEERMEQRSASKLGLSLPRVPSKCGPRQSIDT